MDPAPGICFRSMLGSTLSGCLHLMIMAAPDHPWRLDLSSLAAILAAAGTGALALFTWRLAHETHDLAGDTEEDVRATFRPVLIKGQQQSSVSVAANAQSASLMLQLHNVGPGPAMNAALSVVSKTSARSLQSERQEVGTIAPNRDLIATVAGVLFADQSSDSRTLRYEVRAEYADLSGRAHATEWIFEDPSRGAREVRAVAGYPEAAKFPLDLVRTRAVPPG